MIQIIPVVVLVVRILELQIANGKLTLVLRPHLARVLNILNRVVDLAHKTLYFNILRRRVVLKLVNLCAHAQIVRLR